MGGERGVASRLLAPGVLATFSLLVVPTALGSVDTTLATPLALPGYLLVTLGSALGSRLAPQYALWLYWIPFVVGSYLLAVVAVEAGRVVAREVGH